MTGLMHDRYKQTLAKNRERCKVWHAQHKEEALRHYSRGEPKCACCGESHLVFLTLDHIKGGGHKHRKSLRADEKLSGAGIYRWAKKNDWPKIFRVMCFNCNFAIHVLGKCPHAS